MCESATALVTGGSSGIGRAVAVALAEKDANVVVADVEREGGQETVAAVEQRDSSGLFVETDVTEADDVQEVVATAVDSFGSLDIAVNNAGVEGRQKPLNELSEAEWELVTDVNLSGVWRCMKYELDQMTEQQSGGAIVNTGSLLGEVGLVGAAGYTAAKHGVHGLTKTAALEFAEQDIRINAVCPGFVDSPMLERSRVGEDSEARKTVREKHPMNRFADPEEVADAVCWLCSDDASFTTGTVLRVDGGYLSQ